MARIGIIFGLLLCGLTIAGMSATTQKSYTQFVPMMFGIPMLFLGVVSLNPHRRAGSIFVAFVLSVFAVTLGGGRLLVLAMDWSSGEYVNPISLRLVITMTALSLAFVLIAWWWQRRRVRDAAAALTPSTVKPIPAEPIAVELLKTESPPDFGNNPYQTPPILDEPVSQRRVLAAQTEPGESTPDDPSRSKSK